MSPVRPRSLAPFSLLLSPVRPPYARYFPTASGNRGGLHYRIDERRRGRRQFCLFPGAAVHRHAAHRRQRDNDNRDRAGAVRPRLGLSPRHPIGDAVRHSPVAGDQHRRRADRRADPALDAECGLRRSAALADAARDGHLRLRQFRADENSRTFHAQDTRRADRAILHRGLWGLFRRGHRLHDAGRADALRHARHPCDERTEAHAGAVHDAGLVVRFHCRQQNLLARGDRDVLRDSRRRLHRRACGKTNQSEDHQDFYCRSGRQPYDLFFAIGV